MHVFFFRTQNVNFPTPFYAPPVILTTVSNGGRSDVPCSEKGPLSAWLEVRTVRVEIEVITGQLRLPE